MKGWESECKLDEIMNEKSNLKLNERMRKWIKKQKKVKE